MEPTREPWDISEVSPENEAGPDDLVIRIRFSGRERTRRAQSTYMDQRKEDQANIRLLRRSREWMEAVRHGDPASDHIPEFTTSEEEAADVLIRVFDLADALKMRLPQALEAKIAYNQRREHMHGKTC